MNTCLVVSGGEYSPVPKELKYDYVIACDAGYNNCLKLDITPDIVIGDFDSFKGNPDTDLGNIPVRKHNVMKDDTDTMLAIKYAIQHGYDHIIICCALGGRMDHTMANIQSLSYIAKRKLSCELISKNEYMTVLYDGCSSSFDREENACLSALSLSDTCVGVTIKGALYELTNGTLDNTFPLGYGNSWAEDTITISLEKGLLLVIISRYN